MPVDAAAGHHIARGTRLFPPQVRFWAPSDPLVWDRRRFEHLLGWPAHGIAAVTPIAPKLGVGERMAASLASKPVP